MLSIGRAVMDAAPQWRPPLRALPSAAAPDDRRSVSARPRRGLPDLATGDLRPNGGMKGGAVLPRDQTRLAARQLDNAPGSARPATDGRPYGRGATPETPLACSSAASPS